MGKAAAIGNKMHGEIEHYLKTGEDTLGDIARRAKQFILKPGSDLIVEHKMNADELTIAGINMTGKIDVVHSRDHYIKPDGELGELASDHVEIIDWKSTSSLERVTPPTTKQCIAYGEWACRLLDVPAARVSLVFVPTKRREPAVKTTRLYTRKQLHDEWQRATPVVETLKLAAKQTDPDCVPANTAACEAYPPHGCPHKQYCTAGQTKTLEQVLGVAGAMSVLDKVLVKQETENLIAEEAQASGVSPEIAEAWAVIESADFGTPATSKEACASVAAIKGITPAPKALAGTGVLGGHTVTTNAELLEIAADIRARQAQNVATVTPPPPPVAAPPLTPPETPASDPAAATAAVQPPADTPPSPAELPPEVPPESMPRPEKRMKKGELLELAERYFEDAVKLSKLGDSTPAATATRTDDVARLELYGNCSPGTESQPLEPYIDGLIEALCAPYKIPGLRSAPNDSPLGYNAWKDALAALANERPPAGVFTVDLRNEYGEIVFNALRGKCTRWARA